MLIKIITILFIILPFLYSPVSAKTLLYVTHEAKREIAVYDADSEKIIKKIATEGMPYHIVHLPNKKEIAVSLKAERSNFIRIIDLHSGGIKHLPSILIGRYKKTGEIHLIFNKDGRKLYAIDNELNYVDVIDTERWGLLKRVILGYQPRGGIITSDGSSIIIPNLYSGDIIFLDTSKDKVLSSIKIDGQPSAVTISRDGKNLYIADKKNSQLLFINLEKGDIIGRAAVGNDPVNTLLSPDGETLYVANFSSNSLTVINTKRMEAIVNIAGGIRPIGMAVDDKTGRLYVCNYGEASIAIIDIKTNRVIRKIPTDITPTNLIIVRQ